MRVSPQPMEG